MLSENLEATDSLFSAIANIFNTISLTSSTNGKQGLLRKFASVPGFKDILFHLYNPYVTTGIKEAKLANGYDSNEDITVADILEHFSVTRTGDSIDVAMANAFVNKYYNEPIAYWLALGIVTKDLQCGVSATTLNNVYGKGFIPRVGIMRGKVAPARFDGLYIATEKIDGNRRLFFNTSNGVETYTRSGKRDIGMKQLEYEIGRYLPKGFVYDCECIAIGDFDNNISLRQASASLLNSKSADKRGIKALCFDMVRIEQYNSGESVEKALLRKYRLACLFGDVAGQKLIMKTGLLKETDESCMNMGFYVKEIHNAMHIDALPILSLVKNQHQAIEVAQPIWDKQGEGIMLVDALSTYQVSDTPKKSWLKVKATVEFTATVIDIYESNKESFAGMVGGLTILFIGPDGKEAVCNVGSGLSQDQRLYWLNHPEKIIGQRIEGDCFGYSKAKNSDTYSLNCPVFKRICGQVD